MRSPYAAVTGKTYPQAFVNGKKRPKIPNIHENIPHF
jgi:hypothetical protein